MKAALPSALRRISIALALLPTLPATSSAGETGFYAGISMGLAATEFDTARNESDLNAALQPLGVSVRASGTDDSKAAFKLHAGYRVTRFLAFEGTYTFASDLGETYRIVSGGTGMIRTSFDVQSAQFSALGLLPLGEQAALFVRGGANVWHLKSSATVSGPGGTVRINESDSGVGAVLGAGALVRFGDRWGARLEWERMFDVGDPATTGQGDIDLITVGLQYHF